MKRYVWLLLLLVMAVAVRAENYFVDGARWTVISICEEPGFDTPIEKVYSIEGTEEWMGEDCLRLYEESRGKKELLTVLKVDGDKVYFRHPKDETQWFLLYDFGLEVGESCDVYLLPEISPAGGGVPPTNVTCVGKAESEHYDGWPVLKICDTRDIEEGLDYDWSVGEWLVGVGAERGLSQNCHYGWIGGAWSRVAEFSVGDDVLCKTNVEINAIEAPECESNTGVTSYYDLSGRRMERPAGPGVYISVQGDAVRKLLVK